MQVNEATPTTLSVVLPMKIEEWSDDLPLKNTFSVGILPLCISQINGKACTEPEENSQILERLGDVKSANDALRSGPDYRVNFLVMKYLSAILPEKLLRPILKSHSTMVFSNLVGPQEVKVLGHSLKNIAFWIPNRQGSHFLKISSAKIVVIVWFADGIVSRSCTGIGCSLLTYRGYLHLSLLADKALVQDEKALSQILEDTVNEIDKLYDKLTLSFFSRKLRRSASTPMKKGTMFL